MSNPGGVKNLGVQCARKDGGFQGSEELRAVWEEDRGDREKLQVSECTKRWADELDCSTCERFILNRAFSHDDLGDQILIAKAMKGFHEGFCQKKHHIPHSNIRNLGRSLTCWIKITVAVLSLGGV